MTLFEAIRQLKEGQAISTAPLIGGGEQLIRWEWGWSQPYFVYSCYDWDSRCYRLIDLPKPKITLEEGIRKALGHAVVREWSVSDILKKLRSLPIDWEAEAKRKEG